MKREMVRAPEVGGSGGVSTRGKGGVHMPLEDKGRIESSIMDEGEGALFPVDIVYPFLETEGAHSIGDGGGTEHFLQILLEDERRRTYPREMEEMALV